MSQKISHGLLKYFVRHPREKQVVYLSPAEKAVSIMDFEDKCQDIKHNICEFCHSVGLDMKVDRKGRCVSCKSYKNKEDILQQNMLPIWYDNHVPQYHVPDVLECLTMAEKMMIQLVSPFIPLTHIKNGTLGISGHVCSFEQDVAGFVDTLPRTRDDVTILRVVKAMRTEIGDRTESWHKQAFKVRKLNILAALHWLKEHNEEYKDIVIDKTRLDWIQDGQNGSLQCLDMKSQDELVTEEDGCQNLNEDYGPCPTQNINTIVRQPSVKAFGMQNLDNEIELSPKDSRVCDVLQSQVNASNKKKEITVEWPTRQQEPINEYGPIKVFARAYPWLFPGGIGDIKDYDNDMKNWAEMLLRYEDGRFAKDKFFVFFALNYITRHRNSKSGNWFIKEFNAGGPDTLEELQEDIKKGNTSFVNRLTYYSKCIKGSSPFWFQKRSEVYSWINHHVEVGNGAPMFFITLSCAEYQWPDIIRLISERMRIAGDDDSDCYVGSPKLSELLNQHALVVQEYFQKRVKLWLDTVGKDVFDIRHYWVRYEFAPGRGQIHAHLLAICPDNLIQKLCHEDLKQTNGKYRRDRRLAEWASKKFGLTASVKDGFDELHIDSKDSPCTMRFTDIQDEDTELDQQKLMKVCQVHNCTGFCMRKKGNKK